MPEPVKIVRGKIVGGTNTVFLIAVDETWGRVFNISTRQLFAMAPLETAVAMSPEAFAEKFDGSEDDEDNILAAALAYDWLQPPIEEYDIPNVDIIDRD